MCFFPACLGFFCHSSLKLLQLLCAIRFDFFWCQVKWRKWKRRSKLKGSKNANELPSAKELIIYDIVDCIKYICLECDKHDGYRWFLAAAAMCYFSLWNPFEAQRLAYACLCFYYIDFISHLFMTQLTIFNGYS